MFRKYKKVVLPSTETLSGEQFNFNRFNANNYYNNLRKGKKIVS